MHTLNKTGDYHIIGGATVYVNYSRDFNRAHLAWGLSHNLMDYHDWAVAGDDIKAETKPNDVVWC